MAIVESIHDKIMRSLGAAEGLYYRLVLLVGETSSGKTNALLDVAKEIEASVINVNLKLSSELLELPTKQRPLRLPEMLDQIVSKEGSSVVVLDNIEMLFDKSLKQDPLRVLQQIARNRTVLSSWNGTCVNGKLTYAEAGHPEHRRFDSNDILVVEMTGSATINSMEGHKEVKRR